MSTPISKLASLLLPPELAGSLADDASAESLEGAVISWLRKSEGLGPEATVEAVLIRAASSRTLDSYSLCSAASLWRWLHELTDSLKAAENAAHCRLLAKGYVVLERWEARGPRLRAAFRPLRLALERRARRDELERSLRDVQLALRRTRPHEGPEDEPGQGVPRTP